MKLFKQFILEARFKSWKKPEVALHGSLTQKIKKFNIPSKGTNNFGLLGNVETSRHGAFFTDNPEFGKSYGVISKYHLNIKNPYKFHEYSHLDFADSIDAFGPHRDIWVAAKHKQHNWQLFDGDLGKHFTSWLQSKGHDSAKFVEHDVKTGQKSNTTVVFNSKNIKYIKPTNEFERTKKL